MPEKFKAVIIDNQNEKFTRKIKEVESGGRPTSIDEPIRLRALINNVGFSINGQSILKKIIQPF